MSRILIRRSALSAALLLMACTASNAMAVTFDLASDWSDISNPNGVWSLNQGTRTLPSTTDWVTGQDAWADQSFPQLGHVPVWLKAEQAFITAFSGTLVPGEVAVGDVIVHGRCCSDLFGDAGGQANVKWTSNVSGLATISGNTWYTTNVDRNVDWDLYLNGIQITDGNVGFGDVYDRADPFDLATGSGGAGVLSFMTDPGDVVMFEVRRGQNSAADHFVGVNLTIDVQTATVPAPGTMALLLLALGGLVTAGKRTRVKQPLRR